MSRTRVVRVIPPAAFLLAVTALAALALPAAAEDGSPGTPAVAQQEPACTPSDMPLDDRPSPYDSVAVTLGETEVKICYGRPSARGRTMIGGDDVPFGELWRTGANEPTTLHTTGPIELAGIPLDAGSYSIYTRPGEEGWEIFASHAVDRWGIPIDDAVRAEEVGSAELAGERTDDHVETMTLRFEESGDGASELVLEWETFRVVVPVRAR